MTVENNWAQELKEAEDRYDAAQWRLFDEEGRLPPHRLAPFEDEVQAAKEHYESLWEKVYGFKRTEEAP